VNTLGWINCKIDSTPEIVLVEASSEVRAIWLTVAMRLQLRLGLYSRPYEFLLDLSLFTDSTKFYLDQDLNENRGEGLKLAKVIRSQFASEIFLITSYPRRNFKAELALGIINDVYGKYPWPFTLENAFDQANDLNTSI